MESIYSELESKICNNKKVYYDDKNNITITNYRGEENGLITKFTLIIEEEILAMMNVEL